MKFITLTLTGGATLLLDKSLIIFAVDYTEFRQITLTVFISYNTNEL
ncbi:hypothetical protein KHA90_06380 [Flavobacterium psychroterrae]|uniref:Uncharacterized protein n=1 Tax=Flavobacterium psychroterrae TaxID=2133767 RepID=A0ABS5P8J7_9FLAO|nr:hypothetical protein [Flavobacterium psychroterrae]MBS7230644.1 hypothetical protein [Flavobacterium psychroterrae]